MSEFGLSPGRRAWLEKLRDGGPANRTRGRVGYDCMRAGWTDWLIATPDGRKLTGAEFFEIPHDERPIETKTLGEIITDAGRAVLARESGPRHD